MHRRPLLTVLRGFLLGLFVLGGPGLPLIDARGCGMGRARSRWRAARDRCPGAPARTPMPASLAAPLPGSGPVPCTVLSAQCSDAARRRRHAVLARRPRPPSPPIPAHARAPRPSLRLTQQHSDIAQSLMRPSHDGRSALLAAQSPSSRAVQSCLEIPHVRTAPRRGGRIRGVALIQLRRHPRRRRGTPARDGDGLSWKSARRRPRDRRRVFKRW